MAADGVGMGPRGRVAWLEVRIEWTHYARRTMGVTLCPLTRLPRTSRYMYHEERSHHTPRLHGACGCV